MQKPKSKKQEVEVIEVSSFEVKRANCTDNGLVFFDMVINGITIYGLRVVEGKNGDFIAFPSNKGKDGNYYNVVWCKFSDDDSNAIIKAVEEKLAE